MPDNVLLVHGYSARSLDYYGGLPALLTNDGYAAQHIYLSAFDSLNDDITCDDLANALEVRVAQLEATGLDIKKTALIVHSTGAIIARRWILNRHKLNRPLPSHFISLGGANHGSTLAQLGNMQLVHLYRGIFGTSVGAEVLQDLDFGSEFLLQLNEDWLDAYLSSQPPSVFCFGLSGDDHSAFDYQLFWQTHEDGSDAIVRISGGNLNYEMLSIDQNDINPILKSKRPLNSDPLFPHLVLHGVSHVGNNGIMGGNTATMKIVYPEIKAALAVTDTANFRTVESNWRARTAGTGGWNSSNPSHCNSTVVFSLQHPGGRKVQDSLILIKDSNQDQNQALANVGASIEPRQPIQNATTPSSVSFYVNYPKFCATYPHTVSIEVQSGCDEIVYPPVQYSVQVGDIGCVQPNQFTYVKVTLKRESAGTYSIIPLNQNLDIHKQWPPLPQPNR
jgi:Lipase (class 2)